MLRETQRSRFSPALEVAGSGLGEQPSRPLRVKTEVAALRRDVYFSLPTAVIQRRSLVVALRRVDRLSRQGKTGNGAYLTRDEHLSNTRRPYPEGEGIYATSGRAAPLRCGANYRMKGTIRVLAHLFCVNSKGISEICPLRICADASPERAASPIVGTEGELKANTRLPPVRPDP